LTHCYDKCPEFTEKNEDTKMCEPCGDKYYDLSNERCVSKCSSDDFVYEEERTQKMCLKKCSLKTKHLSSNEKNCVSNCADDETLDPRLNQCFTKCLHYKYQGQCVDNCPVYTIINDTTSECVSCEKNEYFNGMEKKCEQDCPSGTYKMLKEGEKYCASSCVTYVTIGGEKECMSECQVNETYVEANNTCIDQSMCSNYIKIIRGIKTCVDINSCELLHLEGNVCKSECKVNEYYYSENNQCYSNCPDHTQKENNTEPLCKKCDKFYDFEYKNCTDECNAKYIFTEDNKKTCITKENCIKEGHLIINGKNECVKECGSEYKYKYNNICYDECPEFTEKQQDQNVCVACGNMFYDAENKKCVTECPENYVVSVDGKICEKCPDGKWPEGKYYYGGVCYDICPNNYKKILQKHSTAQKHWMRWELYRYNLSFIRWK